MLSHNGNLLGTTCGKHYHSALNDLRTWVTHGCAYQAKGVVFADGVNRSFGRRERPHLIWKSVAVSVSGETPAASTPVPVALSTAVTSLPTKCIGSPCLWRYPDASYTLLQAVRT